MYIGQTISTKTKFEKARVTAVVNSSARRRGHFISQQYGKEKVVVTLSLDIKTRWNSTLTMLERAYRLRNYTYSFLADGLYVAFRPLLITSDEWHAVEYVMEVLRPFRYWTLWMSMRYTFTIHRVITIYNDSFDHMDGVLKALAMKTCQWKKDISTKYYTKVTPETGLLLILDLTLDLYRKTTLFKKWDKEIENDHTHLQSYTAQYRKAFMEYWIANYVNNYSLTNDQPPTQKFDHPPYVERFITELATRPGVQY